MLGDVGDDDLRYFTCFASVIFRCGLPSFVHIFVCHLSSIPSLAKRGVRGKYKLKSRGETITFGLRYIKMAPKNNQVQLLDKYPG